MGLELKFGIINSTDCKSFSFVDLTGIYNATSNPTGFGGANPATTDMAMASLTVLLADGTQQVFTLGFYPLFPNTNGVLFNITNQNLGLPADQPIQDWISNISYHVSENSDGSDGYTTAKYVFISCQSDCCRSTALSNISFGNGCSCDNPKFQDWSKINAMFEAINNALECSPQLPNKANAILTTLTEACNKAGCSCGCN